MTRGALGAAGLDPSRIVVLTGCGLGETVLTRPSLRALRRAYPTAEMTVAGPARYRQIVSDVADEVLDIDTSTTRGLAELAHRPEASTPDLAINLHDDGPQSHMTLAMLRPGRLVAFSHPPVHLEGPAWKDREPGLERWARLLDEGLAIPTLDEDVQLPATLIGDVRRHGAVIVHPADDGPGPRWPAASYARACRMLAERGYRVVVIGTAAQRRLVETVGAGGGVPLEDRLAGRTDVAGFVRLIAGASLVLTASTGVALTAEVVGTPTVRMANGNAERIARKGPHTLLKSARLDTLDVSSVVMASLARLEGLGTPSTMVIRQRA